MPINNGYSPGRHDDRGGVLTAADQEEYKVWRAKSPEQRAQIERTQEEYNKVWLAQSHKTVTYSEQWPDARRANGITDSRPASYQDMLDTARARFKMAQIEQQNGRFLPAVKREYDWPLLRTALTHLRETTNSKAEMEACDVALAKLPK